jgi:NAD(P)-dependent dehydrogenase (short-subunit alcohol dehydrogenase family)
VGDLDGRTFLVTGANTGIGKETVRVLAARGAKVVLACLARDEPLHVLINNAGLAGRRGTTDSGVEISFGTNHVGPFLLTSLLLDRLRQSAPGRIVNVASGAHFGATGIDFEAVRKPTRTITLLRDCARARRSDRALLRRLRAQATRCSGDGNPGRGAVAAHRRLGRRGLILSFAFTRPTAAAPARRSSACTDSPTPGGRGSPCSRRSSAATTARAHAPRSRGLRRARAAARPCPAPRLATRRRTDRLPGAHRLEHRRPAPTVAVERCSVPERKAAPRRLGLLDGLGHCPQLDVPLETGELIIGFTAR